MYLFNFVSTEITETKSSRISMTIKNKEQRVFNKKYDSVEEIHKLHKKWRTKQEKIKIKENGKKN